MTANEAIVAPFALPNIYAQAAGKQAK